MRTWTTKTGEVLPLKKIGNAHLGNILRLLQRNGMMQKEFAREAQRRQMFWDMDELCPYDGMAWRCWFDVDGKRCNDFAVMLTASKEACVQRQDQIPYCASHRPDAASHYKWKCAGCKSVKPLVTQILDMKFCEECTTADSGQLIFKMLAWLLFFVTLGYTRKTQCYMCGKWTTMTYSEVLGEWVFTCCKAVQS